MNGALVLVLLSAAGATHAYPNGAPQSACASMTPSPSAHGATAQTSPSPYVIEYQLMSGGDYKVTLKGKRGEKFRGFMLRAVQSVNGRQEPFGTMELDYSSGHLAKPLDCTSVGDTVTHADASDKTELTATWRPPREYDSDDDGAPAFVATVVQSKQVFWTGVTDTDRASARPGGGDSSSSAESESESEPERGGAAGTAAAVTASAMAAAVLARMAL